MVGTQSRTRAVTSSGALSLESPTLAPTVGPVYHRCDPGEVRGGPASLLGTPWAGHSPSTQAVTARTPGSVPGWAGVDPHGALTPLDGGPGLLGPWLLPDDGCALGRFPDPAVTTAPRGPLLPRGRLRWALHGWQRPQCQGLGMPGWPLWREQRAGISSSPGLSERPGSARMCPRVRAREASVPPPCLAGSRAPPRAGPPPRTAQSPGADSIGGASLHLLPAGGPCGQGAGCRSCS